MGACLNKLGINIGIDTPNLDVPNVMTSELLQTITDSLQDALLGFPDSFNHERRKVIWDVWWEADKGWMDDAYCKEKLFWKDFPGNDNKIIQVALAVASGEALKNVLGDVVHSIVDPEINSKLDSHPYAVRAPAKKGADKAIEKAIDEAVDKAVEQLRNKIQGGTEGVLDKFETPKEGEKKPTGGNPALEKIKGKKK